MGASRQEEATKHVDFLMAVSACLFASCPARAELASFEFSTSFAMGSAGSMILTGRFDGNLTANRITDFSNATVFRNGAVFRGSGALFALQYDKQTRRWVPGGYLSLDGSNNNLMLIDSDYANGDASFHNYVYSVTGLGNAAFLPSYQRYRVPETTGLTVRQSVAAGVPEPSTWALFVLGFGILGTAMRQRRGARVALAA